MIAKPHFEPSLKTEVVPIDHVKPSPENDELYGAIDPTDLDLINLANDIAENGVREPLQMSVDGFLVSGHRRYAACKLVGLTKVPVRRLPIQRYGQSAIEWKRLLAAYNHQRVKTSAMRVREVALGIDPDLAHKQLIEMREEIDRDAPPQIDITGEKTRSIISDRKRQFLEASLKVIEGLREYWPVTVRQVHYGLLNDPPLRNTSSGKQRARYANDAKSYHDLCDLLTRARLLGLVPWEAIKDETRPVSGLRYQRDVAGFVDVEAYSFLRGYRRDLLQSQPDHVELIVEKLTVQGIVEPIAKRFCVPMTVGRGYCSIDPRFEIVQRYKRSGKDRLKLLIAADFDPDGEEIAESLARSIRDDFGVTAVTASKILLRDDQARDWKLPHNGLEAKESSSKFTKFVAKYGSNRVYELEAVPPPLMQSAVQEAIEATIDVEAFNDELAQERRDAAKLEAIKRSLQDAFLTMLGNDPAEDWQ